MHRQNTELNELPWVIRIREKIGEDPTRFLTMCPFGPIDVPPLVEARINGIDEIGVANAWLIAERRLFDREGVKQRLRARIEYLLEHGERDQRASRRELPTPEPKLVEDPEPTWAHEGCGGTDVDRESSRTWFCNGCQQRTNRVLEAPPA